MLSPPHVYRQHLNYSESLRQCRMKLHLDSNTTIIHFSDAKFDLKSNETI